MKHILIESDNLIALKQLFAEYVGAIDVIPIDPPYNTHIDYIGYKDGDYSDGWIEFMRPRLEITYKLLSKNGVMFIHIDESELVNLLGLCGDIFGSSNLMTMIWKKTNNRFDKNRKEKPIECGIRRTHEYIVVCFKDKKNTTLKPILQPVWNGTNYVEVLKPLETVVDDMGTTASAKDELSEILGKREIFSTPKPVKMIKEFIRAASDKNSIVLDFFAGSGTTGHAVMELNCEDGGSRKFILITNDESNICQKVTLPRLEKVIKMQKYNAEIDFRKL